MDTATVFRVDQAESDVKYAAVFTDLDNTFWVPGKGVPPANTLAVQALGQMHVPLIPVTGRDVDSVIRCVKIFQCGYLPLFPGVYSDGAMIYGQNKDDLIYCCNLELKELDQVRQAAVEFSDHTSICAERHDSRYFVEDLKKLNEVVDDDFDHLWSITVEEFGPSQNPPWQSETSEKFLSLHVFYDTQFESLDLLRKMTDKFDNIENITYSVFHSERFVVVRPKSAGKANAVKFLAKRFGYDMDKVLVCGDGPNDIEMIKSFRHSLAMLDGVQPVREASEEVSKLPAGAGGWGEAVLNRFGVTHAGIKQLIKQAPQATEVV